MSDSEKSSGCPMHHDAKMDFSDAMDYGDYLGLDSILEAQHPRSSEHDEMLFIVQHQTSELWMKLLLHELFAAQLKIQQDDLSSALKMLTRVTRIMEQLVAAWTVLGTLTPAEYATFRPYLAQSSGFQSYQYRQIEFAFGNKNAALLQPHTHRAERHTMVQAALLRPSIYDDVIALLARRGCAISAARLQHDVTLPTTHDHSVETAWLEIYHDPQHHWDLYALAEKLVDIEDAFRLWRFRHVTTVERIIGFKQGTGGTEGVHYLRKMLDVILFPELWSLRTKF